MTVHRHSRPASVSAAANLLLIFGVLGVAYFGLPLFFPMPDAKNPPPPASVLAVRLGVSVWIAAAAVLLLKGKNLGRLGTYAGAVLVLVLGIATGFSVPMILFSVLLIFCSALLSGSRARNHLTGSELPSVETEIPPGFHAGGGEGENDAEKQDRRTSRHGEYDY